MPVEIIPIIITKDIEENDDLADLILTSSSKPEIKNGDILIITQKVISKQEGCIVNLSTVTPSLLATGMASEYDKDPRIVEVILGKTKRIVRMNDGIIIVETFQNLICANAGVDESNVKNGYVTFLPNDLNESAKKLRQKITEKTGKSVAVLISDTFGRPFRIGQTNQAVGSSGICVMTDYVGTKDAFGKTLQVTAIAIADELCSAAELVMGKVLQIPVAIIRNYKFKDGISAADLIRPKETDLFR